MAERLQRRLAAILAADVVGYSRLMAADERGTLARLRTLRQEAIDPAIAAHGGRIVKLMGDGMLVEFASAVDAVTCAAELQALAAARNDGQPAERAIRFRIGINLGDIIVEGDDLFGDGVNVAARIEGVAVPGEVWMSRSVAEQVRDKLEITLESRGEHALKNIPRPVEVFRIATGEAGAAPAPAPAPAPALPEKPSIAVLAFDNMSGDPEQEYFSDGICEDILTDLSKLSELHVIARNSSFVYKGSSVSIPDVARQLGVRYVLEGSVRRAGNRIRVTAQLIDATTGGHVWADRYDRNLTDIFEVQDELTREIVNALKIRLTAQEERRLDHRQAVGVEAYGLFLQGREQVWLHTRAGNLLARDLLGRALALEPGYAAALALVAITHVIDYVNGWGDDPEGSLAIGRDLARTAAGMDPNEAQVHIAAAIAAVWQGDLDVALASAERCIALQPSSTDGRRAKAAAQIYMGRPQEALATIEAYMRFDPVYPEIALQFQAEALFLVGDYPAAERILRCRLERNPAAVTAYELLAASLGLMGRTEEAAEAWAQVLRLAPSFSIERRRRVLPFRNPADFERRVEGLRRAGVTV